MTRGCRTNLGIGVAAVVFAVAYAAAIQVVAQGPPLQSVWIGVYTLEQAKRGEPLYAQNCASCHGATLDGGEMAPPLTGGQFTANWNGLTLGDLAERIRISMPQNAPGSLSRAQCADILAFMLKAGMFPDGHTELPRDVETLRQIRFDAMKP